MSEFEDREKNLGNLPEDIMRERGEWPIGKPGRARRSNIPPDVESRARATRGTEIDDAPESRTRADYGVTSVYDARPVDGVDFFRQDSDVDTAVSKANFKFGDYVETLFTRSDSEGDIRYGIDFYKGNYYIADSTGNEKVFVVSPSGDILFEFDADYPIGSVNATVADMIGIAVVRSSKGDIFYYVACTVTDGVGNRVLVYDAGGNFVQEADGFTLKNGESSWDGIDFHEKTNKVIYGGHGGYLYYGTLDVDNHKFTLEKDFRPDTSARDVSFIYPDDDDLILYLTEADIIKVVRISDESSPDSFDAERNGNSVYGMTVDNEGYIIAGMNEGSEFSLDRRWPYDSDSKDVIDLSASFTVPESYVAVVRNIAYTLSPLFATFEIGDIVARVKVNNRTVESINAVNCLVEDKIDTYFLADEGDEVSIDLKVSTINVMTTSSLYRIAFELNAFFTGNLLLKRGRELQYEPANKRLAK